MRRSFIATSIILFSLTKDSLAFSPNSRSSTFLIDTTTFVSSYNVRQGTVALHMVEEKKLTAADILARARKKVNCSGNLDDDQDENESAILFDDELMDDMKYCLVTLEKRVKEGPGSLTVQEIQRISDASARIVRDMNMNTVIEQKISSLSATALDPPPPGGQSSTLAIVTDSFNDDTAAVSSVADIPEPADTVMASPSDPGDWRKFGETSEKEEPQYDGKGGLGLAKGSRNAYIIPGMDEMSPKEYQKALQESVSNRQKLMNKNRSGLTGNQAASQYLDQIG